ncbi:hypothetical protein COY27_02745 [Candidatus Woesearchaeota archaeon CG_4_10_14_0_2_um_filter_33_13]|nr:MAG: hypothetical protein COY27_02745 [Candidatus Woesearchaeota archaeon CG_4_10_14_0_2_um_filter_33_13]
MGGRRVKKKEFSSIKNRRLDLFINKVEIERTEREKVVREIKDLTFNVITGKSVPKLRLKKLE